MAQYGPKMLQSVKYCKYNFQTTHKHLVGDEIAATALKMNCTGGSGTLEPPARKQGNWLGDAICPYNQVICGLQTRVQDDSGILIDDTALNDVKFLCCDYTQSNHTIVY